MKKNWQHKAAGGFISACCLFFILIGVFITPQTADAAEILQSSGSNFSSPTIDDNKVRINLTGSVKYIRHTKYMQSSWSNPVAYKQLRANSNFVGFAYSCPGYYMTRIYADSAGTQLIGWVRVYVANSDITNTSCPSLYDQTAKAPSTTQKINVTHPSDVINEPSKMINGSTNVSASTPVTRDTTDEDLVEFAAGQVPEGTLTAEQACNAKAASTGVGWQLKYNSNTSSFECVVASDCLVNAGLWHCNAQTVAQKYPSSTNTIDNPDRTSYEEDSCSDATASSCLDMYTMSSYSRPTNGVVNEHTSDGDTTTVPEIPEPTNPEPTNPTNPTDPSWDYCQDNAWDEEKCGERQEYYGTDGMYKWNDSCDPSTGCDPTESDLGCLNSNYADGGPYSWMEYNQDLGICKSMYICAGDSPYVGTEVCDAQLGSNNNGGGNGGSDPQPPPGPNCDVDIYHEECIPDCYCPELDKYGAGLGFMCCVWDCPGLEELAGDFKNFLSDDLVGTAVAPEVPEFEPPSIPNIFDILNNVDKNDPEPITTTEDPNLKGFTADDVRMNADQIPFRDDPTGGFDIVNPLTTLPEDGSTAPRPKDEQESLNYPGSSGNTQHTNEQGKSVPKPSDSGNTNNKANYPSFNGSAKQPGYSDNAKQPDYNDTARYPTLD